MSPTSSSEVLVVGAGIAGAGAAFFLAEWGVNVTLVEREHPASGPTGRSSAVLHAFYLMPELSLLAARGIDILRQIPDLTGGTAGFNAIGTLWGAGPETAKEFREAAQRISKQGCEIEALEASELPKIAPNFNWDGIEMAVWEPTCGYADSYSATNALVNGARDRGAKIKLNTPVTRLVVEHGRIQGVEIEGGETIGADIVIAAAGVWTKPLLAQVGVDLPLTIERHPHAVVDAIGFARKVMPVCWVDDALMNYGRPEGGNSLILASWSGGGTGVRHDDTERGKQVSDPEAYNEGMETDEATATVETFVPRIPEIEQLGIRPGYSGLYDMSPDDNPIIDAVPGVEGLFAVCGSSG
ncbi:MAG: FAD-binding oxidoreductase, partial [Gammaproteobacteria bacterium]|nr:FAD-binding oxidoreductase [Gammaproteobacteria bacterium]